MHNEMKTVYKLFAAWQDDREEEWLRDMAHQGWHLVLPNSFRYTFRRGEPRDIVYRLDYYNPGSKAEKQAYYDLFGDAGWELVGELVGRQYFRKPARPGEVDEIYTDNQSKILKHRRLMILFGILLLVMGFNMINIGNLPFPDETPRRICLVLMTAAAALNGYALLRTWLRVRALQSL